jgi:hypothetical protein
VAVLATAGIAAGDRSRSPVFEAATIDGYSAASHRSTTPRAAAESALAPPRAATPSPGAVLHEGPMLSWRFDGEPLDGARVELSPTPDFDEASTVRYDVRGEELGVPTVPGVWYWRLRGRSRGVVGSRPGPTRFFTVRVLRSRTPRPPDEPDWNNPYDLLLRGLSTGPWSDMR